MANYISIVDDTDRTSTLDLTDDGIVVIGVLPHGTEFVPKTVADAEELIAWLEDFIENFDDEETEDDD